MFSLLPLCYVAICVFVIWHKISLPRNRPRQIPTIPFWVSLFDYCRGYGRLAFYEKRLRPLMEEHGAVNVWIAGHWSILVTRPSYLVEMFRNERVIAKAGFRTKVPWGVFARYFGESVITSHGQIWKTMHEVVSPSMTRPIDVKAIRARATELVSVISQRGRDAATKDQALVVDELMQQWTIAVYGDSFLDMSLGKIGDVNSFLFQMSAIQSRMKKSFPSPLFSEFPYLEKFPWLFKSRQQAFDNIDKFEELLLKATKPLSVLNAKECNKSKLIYRLKGALEEGKVSDYHYRSNMKNLFAAGHEDAEQALLSLIWTLAINQDMQARLRREIKANLPLDYGVADLKELPLLASCVYEILRIFPPIFQLTNRLTTDSVTLGNIPIPEGVYMGWNAYGTHTDPKVWGADAREFRPERWGTTAQAVHEQWRRSQTVGALITFNGYKRKCLGQSFAVAQIMIGITEMVRQFSWIKDPSYQFRITTGPILSPHGARFIFKSISEDSVAI